MKAITLRHAVAVLIMLIKAAVATALVTVAYNRVAPIRIAIGVLRAVCAVKVLGSEGKGEVKISWLAFILVFPAIGSLFYLLMHRSGVGRREERIIRAVKEAKPMHEDFPTNAVEWEPDGSTRILLRHAGAHRYGGTDAKYFSSGEKMAESLLADLLEARRFIFLEFYTISEGRLWNEVFGVLEKKARLGVEVKIIYDDLGSISGVPREIRKRVSDSGIVAIPHFRLGGVLSGSFNSRTHRKIAVIDGEKGYTGGVNMADEYVSLKNPYGVWKDGGVRISGEAVDYLSYIFLSDLALAKKEEAQSFSRYYRYKRKDSAGYVIPYGDGPSHLSVSGVSHALILSMLAEAKGYVYLTTPYLIPDAEISAAIINAAERGIDVRIVTPHIPDKRLIFFMTRDSYARFLRAGVRIYEYTPGFMHAKLMVRDGVAATVGSVNLDHRSLIHNLECGVFLYRHAALSDIEKDVRRIIGQSEEVTEATAPRGIRRVLGSIVKIFAPLM